MASGYFALQGSQIAVPKDELNDIAFDYDRIYLADGRVLDAVEITYYLDGKPVAKEGGD